MTTPPAGERRRVLHLITTLDRGGAENALLHLCRGMRESSDWDPRVGYLKGDGELTPEFEAAGIAVEDVALGTLRIDRALTHVSRLLAEFEPDVVHTHLFKADCLGAAVAGSTARPVLVSTKHNEDDYLSGRDPASLAWRTLGRGAARRADAVVAISDGVARFVRAHLGTAPARLETIRYGVPELPRGDGAYFRAVHGLPDDAPVVLCAARLEPQKDHETLFRAFAALPEELGAHLVLLGRGSREAELRKLAGDRVVFAGFVENPVDAYAAADVIALSSRHEGLGLVLVEAALAGVPAVATNVGGIAEAVRDGVTGLLAPAADADAASKALGTSLARLLGDADERARMGAAARDFARERFSVERYVREHLALYAELLDGGA